MGTIEPPPRAIPRSRIKSGWLLALVSVGAGLWFWLGRPEAPDVTPLPDDPQIETSSRTDALETSEIWEKNRQIGELELKLRSAEDDRLAAERELESLRRDLAETRDSEARYRQGLDDAVAELNQLKSDLGRVKAQASTAPDLGSLLPRDKTGPLGPPQVLVTQMGFVTVSGLVRNPTRFLSRGRLEVSLVGSAGVIETRGFPMRVAPESTERYDVTFPNIFPTERIAAQAIWVD
jgi:hypothetical protein